jgi:hypothetical protein
MGVLQAGMLAMLSAKQSAQQGRDNADHSRLHPFASLVAHLPCFIAAAPFYPPTTINLTP